MRVPVTVISASGGATVPAGAGEASCACAGRFHSSATVSAVADTIDVDLDMYFPLFSISVRGGRLPEPPEPHRSEEHTSELQSLMRISYAVFCLKQKKTTERKDTRNSQICT